MRFLLFATIVCALVVSFLTPSCGGSPTATDSCGAGESCTLECNVDTDCAQPADKRCGAGKCAQGKCQLDVRVGAIASQIYGDCQRVECDEHGAIVSIVDPTDVYDDGRECTWDYCVNLEAKNDVFPDGLVCPESQQGACYQGDCRECLAPFLGGKFDCGKPNHWCHYYWCIPMDPCGAAGMMGCGGVCEPCGPGNPCGSDAECYYGSCEGGKCQQATCDDGRKNDKETGVDCGGPACPICPAGQGCIWPTDCESDVCIKGECQAPSCIDGKKNGAESGIDCGGPCDPC